MGVSPIKNWNSSMVQALGKLPSFSQSLENELMTMVAPAENAVQTLERIAIIENSFHPGMGLFIARGFADESNETLETKVIDSEEAVEKIIAFKPQVAILDLDSMRRVDALQIALDIRKSLPDQVIIFMAGKANPIFAREGMLSALWDRAYWLNEPSRNPSVVLSEILSAYNGLPQVRPSFLEAVIDETNFAGLLSPHQHRVMRLMALGGSNSEIAHECKVTEKAVERTISAASKLLEVTPASTTTNHRVNAANKYLRALFYSDTLEM